MISKLQKMKFINCLLIFNFIKKKYLYLFLGLILSNISFADTTEQLKSKFVLENMQNDYATCYIFYKINFEGMKNIVDIKKDIVEGLEQSADTTLKLVYETSELIGINAEDIKNVIKQEMETQVNIIDNDYGNISILLEKYALFCKNLIENKKQRIDFWEKKAESKFK